MQKKLSKKNILIFTVIILIITLVISIYFFSIRNKNSANNFTPKVLVMFEKGTDNYLDIYNNYNQSYILNAEVDTLEISDNIYGDLCLQPYDVIYPDISLIENVHIENIKEDLIEHVKNGGNLFLEYDWHKIFPEEFTGVKSSTAHVSSSFNFSYPEVDFNFKQLQLVASEFLNSFVQYRKSDFDFLKFNKFALSETASPIVNIDNFSILSLNKYQNGYVLMASDLIPNTKLITGFDLSKKNDKQEYFDYSFASINYFLRNEFLAASLKEKYGFTFKKIFGPYGRPAMAWQNHYEGLSSIKDKEMIKWIDLLKDYHQIPSTSLIRSTFDWGKWYSDITVHLNVGTNLNPEFIGEEENSYYSSGNRITVNNKTETFGEYPIPTDYTYPIQMPHRAYPVVVDYENDDDNDLIVGNQDGYLYLLENISTNDDVTFKDKIILKVSTGDDLKVQCHASPCIYDINNDDLFDLIVGDEKGNINVFLNIGSVNKPLFNPAYLLSNKNGPILVDKIATPRFGDIDNDNIDDLIIGDSTGKVYLYKKSDENFTFDKIIIDNNDRSVSLSIYSWYNDCKYVSPLFYDWNNDNFLDILLGDNSGRIKIFLNSGTDFEFSGFVEGKTKNKFGTSSLFGGHNSVPLIFDWNNDGKNDLIVGQLEFSIPIDIDSQEFQYKEELKEIIKYCNDHGVPIYPHIYIHKYKSSEQEIEEIQLHKKAFEFYELEWSGGSDQHTWQTNQYNPQQTLINEFNSGIWWNFGFNPPNQPDLPRDAKEYLWSIPFLLTTQNTTNKLLTYEPSPNLFMYPDVYDDFAKLDMPIIYFEHIEYAFRNTERLDNLKEIASYLNVVRENGNYNFVTQEQMAKSFMNTFYSKAYVNIGDNQITLNNNISDVPSQAGEYLETLGVKFEVGEKYLSSNIQVSSPIQYTKQNDIYFGVFDGTKINIGIENDKESNLLNNNFYIERSNIPIKIKESRNSTKIKMLDWGMQQIKIKAKKPIKITGERLIIKQNGDFYTITHYGYPVTVKIEQ